ncbi:MAG: thiamine pyrophosphate-binding protein [Synergistales bacterium]|nr:thiamine pyrophosphate-binding protein [Synergistales bacterium]
MTAAQALLEMLRAYHVEYVFGLPGETTLGLYDAWKRFDGITHVMARDERNAVFMADGYARVSGRPGVCEGPSVGATHMIPGVVEAAKSFIPLVVMTSDIPLHMEKHNMLTGFDQTGLFAGVAKESLTATRGEEIPYLVQRAFRVATGGSPGPVHLRLPMDVLAEEIHRLLPPAQERFAFCPGTRPVADPDSVQQAARALADCDSGVMVCGQGVLTSRAWEEVAETAERFGLAVATTINGKGSIAETHPLSVGVIGSRGSTAYSNRFLEEADLVVFVGSSTDSVGTDGGRLPPEGAGTRFVHLNPDEGELGNSCSDALLLQGDAQSTLRALLVSAEDQRLTPRCDMRSGVARRPSPESCAGAEQSARGYMDPRPAVGLLTEAMPEDAVIVADPGMSAVYPAAFYRIPRPGRYFVCNYAMGALGYGFPAALGVSYAIPEDRMVLNFTGDGSFGFTAGELETLARLGRNVKVVLFNNESYGWIRATNRFSFGGPHFATDFQGVDYVGLAESCRIPAFRAASIPELRRVVSAFYDVQGPALLELVVPPEDRCVPPVPDWAAKAAELGMECPYW